MLKKLLPVMLVCMLLCLGGCGDKNEEPTKLEDTPVESVEVEKVKLDPAREAEVISKAEYVASLIPKSKSSLSSYLQEYEGFTEDEANFAVENCNVDWNEEAVEYVYYILGASPDIDADRMEGQLGYEGFTEDEIKYALDKCYN